MSSARSGASPSSRGGGDAFGEFGPRTGEPSSTQGTPVHVPNPPSTDGTPSTAYLERARSFAERMQASMASAVKGDPLYNTLASSPATEGFASARAKELMEELIEAERVRDEGEMFHGDGNERGGLAERIARLANEPLRTGEEGDPGTSYTRNDTFDTPTAVQKGNHQSDTGLFVGRVESIPPATVERRTGGQHPDQSQALHGEFASTGDRTGGGTLNITLNDENDRSFLETEREVYAEVGPSSSNKNNGFDPSSKLALFSKYLSDERSEGVGFSGTGGRDTRATRRELEQKRRDMETSKTENELLKKKLQKLEKKSTEKEVKLADEKSKFAELRAKYVALGEKLSEILREKEHAVNPTHDLRSQLEVAETANQKQRRKIKTLTREVESARETEKENAHKMQLDKTAAAAKEESKRAPEERLLKEVDELRDVLAMEQKKRSEAEHELSKSEKKLTSMTEKLNVAEESARRANVRTDSVAVDADASLRKKIALEEQRLGIEMERRSFEIETAFSRRERGFQREIDALKLELERVVAQANNEKAEFIREKNAAAHEAALLRLPAPETSEKRPYVESEDDAKTVAASLASAVLKALDDRAPSGDKGHDSAAAVRAEAAASEARRLAEQSIAMSQQVLKASEDERRQRDFEENITSKLESKFNEIQNRNRRDSNGSDVSEKERKYKESVLNAKVLDTERLVEIARDEASIASRTAEQATRAEQEAVARCNQLDQRATQAETALEDVKRKLEGAEVLVAERVAEETRKRIAAEKSLDAASEKLTKAIQEKELYFAKANSFETRNVTCEKENFEANAALQVLTQKLEVSETSRATSESEASRLDAQLASTRETVSRLTGDVERFRAQLAVSEAFATSKERESTSSSQKIEKLERQVVGQTDSVRDAERKAVAAERKSAEIEMKKSDVERRLGEHERKAMDFERRAGDAERGLSISTSLLQIERRKVSEAVRALRRVKEQTARETKTMKDALFSLRRSVKERLENSWEVMKAEAAESARKAAAATLLPARTALEKEIASAKEETRLAKLAQREAKEEAKIAIANARDDARRQHEEAWREVHTALGVARQTVDDAKADAWMSTMELTALKDGVDGSISKEEVGELRQRATDAESKCSEAEKKLLACENAMAAKTSELKTLSKQVNAGRAGEDVLRANNTSTAEELVRVRSALTSVQKNADTYHSGFLNLFPERRDSEVDENGDVLPPEVIVTRAKSKVSKLVETEKSSTDKTQALTERLHSARTQHERLVKLHDEAMARVVASGAAASASEAREELQEIREEVLGLRDAAAADARLRQAALEEAREEAQRESKRADAASQAVDNAREVLVKQETSALEREKMHEEAMERVREDLRVLRAKET